MQDDSLAPHSVSVVVPCYNAESTVTACLEACLGQDYGDLEILFVDDGSTDSTLTLLEGHRGIRVLHQENRGPAAARNLGWRSTCGQIVCFTDADCVPEPSWVSHLVEPYDDPAVGGVGGGYGIANSSSWLARCIHEEIRWRHERMPREVDYLGSFNVSYRRAVLDQVGGFDESFRKASGEDNDLSYRVLRTGASLVFCSRNRVAHYHPERASHYLRQQFWHGFWRVRLYVRQPNRVGGDDYAGLFDLVQPPLALLAGLGWVFGWVGWLPLWVASAISVLLLAAQGPMIWAIVRRTGDARYLGFGWVTALRAFARGLGMALGLLASTPAVCEIVSRVLVRWLPFAGAGQQGRADWEQT